MSDPNQEEILGELIDGIESLGADEQDALEAQLDPEHMAEWSQVVTEFADNAVGSPSWRGDEDDIDDLMRDG